jgi:signal transduction histidine kinase
MRLHNVSIESVIMDVVKDAIAPQYSMLILRDRYGVFYASVKTSPSIDKHLIGAGATISGVVRWSVGGKRKFNIPHITLADEADIEIVAPAPDNPFNSPLLDNTYGTVAGSIMGMSLRRAEGMVLVVWNGDRILIRADNGQIVRADLARAVTTSPSKRLPKYGDWISAVGFPETDFFAINLSHADFRMIEPRKVAAEKPLDIKAKDILLGKHGENKLQPEYHGKLVRITGRPIAMPSSRGKTETLTVDCDGHHLNIDVSSCPDEAMETARATELRITGVCVLDTENWRPMDAFPKIDGMVIVARNADDLVVTKSPPWWTIGRLFIVSGLLLAVIAAILVWNWFLRYAIEKKGRQLYRAEIAKAESSLLIDERTRLAVELHDNIAQSLTGVSFQIDAVEKTLAADAPAAKLLAVAKRTLQSCRKELRRCLWDLRSHTIEEPVFENAIRKTIKPHIGTATVSICFNIQRAKLSDMVAHAILCIIRELTINALIHGKATSISINGERNGRNIVFSVADNGTGFDVQNRPGSAQGHFGIQGIQERIDRFNGTLDISSTIGKGTKVTVVLR